MKHILHELEGTQTIESVMDILNINRQQAIYFIHRLRGRGYVKTKRLSKTMMEYSISLDNKLGGASFQDILNKNSPVKVSPSHYKIHGKTPTFEETLVFAINTRSFRTILASLALFQKNTDWVSLYRMAKKRGIERQVGALYDVSRRIMQTRKMTNRYRYYALRDGSWQYIIPGLKSKDFKDIERKWKVYIPFNKKDLEAYLKGKP